MVTVKESKTGKCVWCAQTREGVQFSFTDGSLSAFVCWPDFRRLVKARNTNSDGNAAEPATAKSERKS